VWSLVLVCLAVGLVACDSRDPQPSGSGAGEAAPSQPAAPEVSGPVKATVNAAEFLTRADAEAVLGKPVGEPSVQNTGGGSSNVTYITSDYSGIGLFVRPNTTAQTFDESQAKSKSVSDVDPATIAGLGEKAYWVGGKVNQLNVLRNRHWLIITIPMGDGSSLEVAKKAAEKILPRVP
jgi:hypothetical protein